MATKYQLVLQFPADALQDYDAMIALEDELILHLGTSADVDGHDFGSGEMNIFIITSEPTTTFESIRPVLVRNPLVRTLTAAYRDLEGEDYTVIWPKDSKKKFEVL